MLTNYKYLPLMPGSSADAATDGAAQCETPIADAAAGSGKPQFWFAKNS